MCHTVGNVTEDVPMDNGQHFVWRVFKGQTQRRDCTAFVCGMKRKQKKDVALLSCLSHKSRICHKALKRSPASNQNKFCVHHNAMPQICTPSLPSFSLPPAYLLLTRHRFLIIAELFMRRVIDQCYSVPHLKSTHLSTSSPSFLDLIVFISSWIQCVFSLWLMKDKLNWFTGADDSFRARK